MLDADGDVVRPAKLWNDTESAPDAGWLIKQLAVDGAGGEAAWAQACGSVPVAAFTITKLSWLHRSEPDAWARVARVCLPHDWLTWKLSGEFVTDRGDASGTGYFSAARNEYAFDLLDDRRRDADWRRALPRVLGPAEARGHDARVRCRTRSSRPAPATTWPPRSRSGCDAGDVAISLGTSGTVYTVSDTPTADPTGAVAGFADATGRFLPLVCTLNATKVTDTMAAWLGVDHDGARRARARRARRRERRRPSCRTSTASARRTGPTRRARSRACAPRRRARTSRAPRSRASCAACSTGSTR